MFYYSDPDFDYPTSVLCHQLFNFLVSLATDKQGLLTNCRRSLKKRKNFADPQPGVLYYRGTAHKYYRRAN